MGLINLFGGIKDIQYTTLTMESNKFFILLLEEIFCNCVKFLTQPHNLEQLAWIFAIRPWISFPQCKQNITAGHCCSKAEQHTCTFTCTCIVLGLHLDTINLDTRISNSNPGYFKLKAISLGFALQSFYYQLF